MVTIWGRCGCPKSFVPHAEQVAAMTGRSPRTARRHLKTLCERGLLKVDVPGWVPLVRDAHGWTVVGKGIATSYELNFAELGVTHMGARHRSHPSRGAESSVSQEETNADVNTNAGISQPSLETNLGGQSRGRRSPVCAVEGAVRVARGAAPRGGPDPPDGLAILDCERDGVPRERLAFDAGSWRVVFPMSEAEAIAAGWGAAA